MTKAHQITKTTIQLKIENTEINANSIYLSYNSI